MGVAIEQLTQDGQPIVRLRSEHLEVDVAPGVGGRIVSVRERAGGYQFLWHNPAVPLRPERPGSEYDPNFYGGIDELLPNDLPETIDGIDCPDHGELWTLALQWQIDGASLLLTGRLPRCGLQYERRMTLRPDQPVVDFRYRLANLTGSRRHFLWKLHAALAIAEGDRIECPARQAQVVDPALGGFRATEPFAWPQIEGQRVDVVPPKGQRLDFFYLFELQEGRVAWTRPAAGLVFEYRFDLSVFPYVWLFASYGGFLGHYTLILEPCTTMPMSVVEAAERGTCSCLEPGEVLETDVSLYAHAKAH